jgi:hypothetical protein
MFPSKVLERLDDNTPKLNPQLANGIACTHLQEQSIERYVNDIFKAAAAGFPPGLTYDGCRRCTPVEEYAQSTKKKGNRYVFDVARSDVFLMKYGFSYMGKPLPPKYLFLPFVSDAGIIYLGGSRFVISPILTDRVISIGLNSIFIRLLKARLTFNRSPQHYLINGVRDSVQVAWSELYNDKKTTNSPKPTVKANCTLVHYLFCKYGFSQTFSKFTGTNPIVGKAEINTENYPEDKYVICSSSCYDSPNKPKGFGKSFYEPSGIRVAVLRSELTPTVKNMLGGFFYCVDHFPTLIKPEHINHTELWMYLLGQIIWSGNISRGTLVSDISDHIASLDEYVDAIVISKLRDIGVECTDIYQLFMLVIEKYNDWILSSDERVNTMYDKELSILYYICYKISSNIFLLYFKLKAAQKKESFNEKKIINIININLKAGLIFSITREHGEVTTTSSSGDNKALKTTLLLVPQSDSVRASKGKKGRVSIDDAGKRLNASIADIGSFGALPKSEPSGRSRLNLHTKISPSGLVLRNPKYIELIDATQLKFKR